MSESHACCLLDVNKVLIAQMLSLWPCPHCLYGLQKCASWHPPPCPTTLFNFFPIWWTECIKGCCSHQPLALSFVWNAAAMIPMEQYVSVHEGFTLNVHVQQWECSGQNLRCVHVCIFKLVVVHTPTSEGCIRQCFYLSNNNNNSSNKCLFKSIWAAKIFFGTAKLYLTSTGMSVNSGRSRPVLIGGPGWGRLFWWGAHTTQEKKTNPSFIQGIKTVFTISTRLIG